MKSARLVVSLIGLACMATACGSGDEPYKPAPAWSGRKPALPPVPALKSSPIKVGDAYTVHGAIHHLRSRLHDKEVTAKDIEHRNRKLGERKAMRRPIPARISKAKSDQPQPRFRVREIKNQPLLRDVLNPAPGKREQRANPKYTKVSVFERAHIWIYLNRTIARRAAKLGS